MTGPMLPPRSTKPRGTGLTAITDVGLPCGELETLLADYADFLDVAKLGVGSAAITPRLADKLELYRDNHVATCCGGTLFEKFYWQGALSDYSAFLREHQISWVEVSSGTVDIRLSERIEIVERFCSEGFVVVGEVGFKDAKRLMPPSQWIEELQKLLDAGCRYVITEGRDSGTAGVYRPDGELRRELLEEIIAAVDTDRIIFEAPRGKAQMFFINTIGPDVNLGNVPARDLLLLESQRRGLRNETFFLADRSETNFLKQAA